MNTGICILVLLAFAGSIKYVEPFDSPTLANIAKELMKKIRPQMSCGFPQAGIPPLVPLVISQKEINLNNSAVSVAGRVENLRIHNLDEFELVDFKVYPIFSKVSFYYKFKNITVEGTYTLDSFNDKTGLNISLKGSGRAQITYRDVEFRGTSRYLLGLTTMELKTLKIRAHLGSVETDIESVSGNKILSSKTNDALQEAIKNFTNNNEEYITNTFENETLPRANEILGKYTWVEMLAFLDGINHCEKSK